MPVQALRSVVDQLDDILRHVNPKRMVRDMAQADKAFHFRNLKGYRIEKIGRGRIRKIVEREILKDPGHDLFANLIIIHWNEAHIRLYEEMVAHVKTINENVEDVERIEPAQAHVMIDDLLSRHRREDVLVCVRLNGVRFDEDVIVSRLVEGRAAPAEAPVADDAAPVADDAAAGADDEATGAPPPGDDVPGPAEEAPPAPG